MHLNFHMNYVNAEHVKEWQNYARQYSPKMKKKDDDLPRFSMVEILPIRRNTLCNQSIMKLKK